MSAQMSAQTCLRCGAAADADATVCFSCGAPLGETETPTQPVRVPRIPKPAAPQPAVATAPPVVTSAPADPRVRGRRLRLAVAIGLGILLAGALLGVGLALRAWLAPAPVARQTTYRDPAGHFQVARPALWTTSALPNGVLFTDSTGTSTARILAVTAAPGQSANTTATQHAQALGLRTEPPRDVAGDSWEVRGGEVTGADGVVRRTTLLLTVHNGLLYTIELSAPISSYPSVNTLVYEPLLASLTLR